MFFDVEHTFILFVIFGLFIFLYHYRATEKFNIVFFVYVFSMMFSELLFLYDFEKYVNLCSFFNIVSQICFLWLLKPVLKVKLKNFSAHNGIELIIGFLGISYVLGYLIYMIFPLIPDVTLLLPSMIAFFVIITICIGFPLFNKHPDNIMLWGVGGGLIGEMCSAFIFEYVSDHRAYIVMAHVFGSFIKIIFTIYLLRIEEIKSSENNYT